MDNKLYMYPKKLQFATYGQFFLVLFSRNQRTEIKNVQRTYD